MTHIDPFAPADSGQHPANYYRNDEGRPSVQTVRHEAMPRWTADPDAPVWSDDENAGIIGQQRWEEYATLLAEYGTDGEREYDRENSDTWPEDAPMPTLVELRHRKQEDEQEQDSGDDDGQQADESKTQTVPTKAQESGQEQPPAQDDDLAAKLAALDEEGL